MTYIVRSIEDYKALLKEKTSVAHIASLLTISVEQLQRELATDDSKKIAHLIVDVTSDDLSVYFANRWDVYKDYFLDIQLIKSKLNTSLNLIYEAMIKNPGWFLIQKNDRFFLLKSTFSCLEKSLGYLGEPQIPKKNVREQHDLRVDELASVCRASGIGDRAFARKYILKSDAEKLSSYIENIKKSYYIITKSELCAEFKLNYSTLERLLSRLNISFKNVGIGSRKGITNEEYECLCKQLQLEQSQHSLKLEEFTEESKEESKEELTEWTHPYDIKISDVTDRLPSLEKSTPQTTTKIELNQELSVEPIPSEELEKYETTVHEAIKLQQKIQFLQWQVESLTKDKEYFQNLCSQLSKGSNTRSESIPLLDDEYPELNPLNQSKISDLRGEKIKMNLSQLQREFGCGWNRLLKMLETLMLNPDMTYYEKGKRSGRVLGPVDIERMRILHEVENRGCATLEETRKMLSLTENGLAELLQRFSIETVEDGMGTKLMDYRDFLLLSKNLSQTVNKAIAQEIDSEKRVLTEQICKEATTRWDPDLGIKRGVKLSDGHGLTLEILPNGKYWYYAFRLHDKQLKLNLGSYPTTSLSAAREMHEQAWKLVRAGQDPRNALITPYQLRKTLTQEQEDLTEVTEPSIKKETVSQTAIKRLQDLNQKTTLNDFNTHYRGNPFEGKNAEELEELLMREYSQYENRVFRKEINDENCTVLQSAAEKMVEEFRDRSKRMDPDQPLSLRAYWLLKTKNPTTGNDRLLLKASLGYLLLNEEISLSGSDRVTIHMSA